MVYSNRPHKFIDLETGEMIRLKPQEIKHEYAKMMKKLVDELKLKCGQFHIDIIDADINDDFRDVLHAYLIKREKLT